MSVLEGGPIESIDSSSGSSADGGYSGMSRIGRRSPMMNSWTNYYIWYSVAHNAWIMNSEIGVISSDQVMFEHCVCYYNNRV